jgi:nitrite reductase/ring-hydroxylating ferredoxin subunit
VAPVVSSTAPVEPSTAAPVEDWKPIAQSSQVPEGKAGTFAVGKTDQVVAIFRHQGALYAIENACAHEDGPIGEGTVKGTRVWCPYHDWEYDFTTGACITDPERRQTCWKTREEGGTIYLGPVAREGTAARGGEHNDGMEVIVK